MHLTYNKRSADSKVGEAGRLLCDLFSDGVASKTPDHDVLANFGYLEGDQVFDGFARDS